MRDDSCLVVGIFLDETGQFVGVMDWSWGLDASNGVVVEEAEFEGEICDHHFDLLDWNSFVSGQVVFNDEVVGGGSQSLGGLLGNEVKLVVIVADVFAQKCALLRAFDFGQIGLVVGQVVVEFDVGFLVDADDNQGHFLTFKLRNGSSHGNDLLLLDIEPLSLRDSFSENDDSLWIALVLVLEVLDGFGQIFVQKVVDGILSIGVLSLRPVSAKVLIDCGSHSEGGSTFGSILISRHIHTDQHGRHVVQRNVIDGPRYVA